MFLKKDIYIFTNGELKRKDHTLCYENEEGRKYLPVEDIKSIYVLGEVTFNKRLVELLSQKEIPVHYFNYYGYYMGTFYPREHLNSGYILLKQAEHFINEDSRLAIAKRIVYGALRNIRVVLKYYNNRNRNLCTIINNIETLAEDVHKANGISQLMSIEGHIREAYYKGFDGIISNNDFIFEKRSRRPPQNRLNTMISFGNSILYTHILSEIYKTHLDPRIGYLHATNFRRFSLNLDISEIFKPTIIDRLIFTLISKSIITKKDFSEENGGIFLKERGKRKFVEQLDDRLQTTIQHRELGRKVSYSRIIRMELYKMEKHILGEKEYSPFIARW